MPLTPSTALAHRTLAACLLMLAAQTPVQAQPVALAQDESSRLYLQAGAAREDTQALTIGATLPWNGWQKEWWGGQVRGHWDFYASQWSADGAVGRVHSTVLGVSPTLRWRPNTGHSAWFLEGGLGANYGKPRFVTLHKAFSTRFNFASHVAVGYSHGAQREHEWQLRIQHSSNGGFKKPNPGQNFLQLRYARHF